MENTTNDVKQRVEDNFEDIRAELSERTHELRETIFNFVDAKPIQAVGIAFGVGYLLSGALFSRTTFKAASIGGRFALGGVLKQLAPTLLAAFLSGREGGEEQQSPSRSPRGTGGNGNANRM